MPTTNTNFCFGQAHYRHGYSILSILCSTYLQLSIYEVQAGKEDAMAHAKSPTGTHNKGSENDYYPDLHSLSPVGMSTKEVLSRFKVAWRKPEAHQSTYPSKCHIPVDLVHF